MWRIDKVGTSYKTHLNPQKVFLSTVSFTAALKGDSSGGGDSTDV